MLELLLYQEVLLGCTIVNVCR